jgi:hypothetical protein
LKYTACSTKGGPGKVTLNKVAIVYVKRTGRTKYFRAATPSAHTPFFVDPEGLEKMLVPKTYVRGFGRKGGMEITRDEE